MSSSATAFCMARFMERISVEMKTLTGYCIIAVAGARFESQPCECDGCAEFSAKARRIYESATAARGE